MLRWTALVKPCNIHDPYANISYICQFSAMMIVIEQQREQNGRKRARLVVVFARAAGTCYVAFGNDNISCCLRWHDEEFGGHLSLFSSL
jgi:hypothetical protein